MDNKEVIDKLQAYYVTQDPSIVARCLANALIDFHRLRNIYDLPEEERDCFLARLEANDEELLLFIENGPRHELRSHNVHTAEGVNKLRSEIAKKPNGS